LGRRRRYGLLRVTLEGGGLLELSNTLALTEGLAGDVTDRLSLSP
jgi:hypothetical protein